MKNLIMRQSRKMKIPFDNYEEIRSKDGISVYRVYSGNKSYVLKYFDRFEDTREIVNYNILSKLKIPTMQVIAVTDKAILLEDIDKCDVWRLGNQSDMQNENVGRAIAKWYRALHKQGREYAKAYSGALYDETDELTLENLERVKEKTGTADDPVWRVIEDNFAFIKSTAENLKRTLTYNDFYYTNLIVAKDLSSAFMFDYNLLGKGYIYSDIRNVTSSLSEPAKTTFLEEYGEFDKSEIIVDEVVSTLICLNFACKREKMPKWGYGELEKIQNGRLIQAVEKLLNEKQSDFML